MVNLYCYPCLLADLAPVEVLNRFYQYLPSGAIDNGKCFACLVKVSSDDILNIFSHFPQTTGFLLNIDMIKLSYAEFARQA